METKPEYHIEDGHTKPPTAYQPIQVPFELHQRVKRLARRLGMTMIDLVDMLVSEAERE
jgi:macrodomain Ter protein organizer (MatP/YcbG family)